MTRPERIEFIGAEQNRLVGDLWDGEGPAVLLLHGGGQTRRAWDRTAERLREAGSRAIALDLRGHGDSDWVANGRYSNGAYFADMAAVARQIDARFGSVPAVVGASLGGLAALGAEARCGPLFRSIVLVDVVPDLDPRGVARIQGFMAERMKEGFASLEEAAEAIARYLPHRARPASLQGLSKNLRLDSDRRYRWHWDPAFMDPLAGINSDGEAAMAELTASLPRLDLPVLLVRGMRSEIVREQAARDFVAMMPNARMVDVGGAGHMVAGDRNDAFADAILSFLSEAQHA
jgi:pimeloyl-ACP methyl ester carboxylesterase